MIRHVMVDLETLGTQSYSAILSIGAVAFDASGIKGSFYRNVDLKSCMQLKLQVDPDTIMWWMSQDQKARDALKDDKEPISKALQGFFDFFKRNKATTIWGNGATFDNVILGNAFKVCGSEVPWRYRDNRCFRTIKAMYPDLNKKPNDNAHNALEDAKWQAEYLIELCKKHGVEL